MSPTRTVVIAAGGTGGHLFPAEALARELKSRGARIVLVTDQRGEVYAKEFPSDHREIIEAATFLGANPIKRLMSAVKIARGTAQARGFLKVEKPLAVIGFGGYPSLPTMTAALNMRLPTAIHEQNAKLGRVNRALSAHMDLIASGFERLDGLKPKLAARAHAVGNPVRPAVVAARETPYDPPSADGPIRLVVFGGSQGARFFSEIMPPMVEKLSPSLRARLQVTQQCRPEDIDAVRTAYGRLGVNADLRPFFTDMPAQIASAHLVIARAGASTVSELAVIGRPSILVPLPTAMDDHQTANAGVLAEAGGAILVVQKTLDAADLAGRFAALVADPGGLAAMATAARGCGKPEAARSLADLVEALGEGRAGRATRTGRVGSAEAA